MRRATLPMRWRWRIGLRSCGEAGSYSAGHRQRFDPEYNLVLEVGPDATGYQDKAHGRAVDAEDNVWTTATNGATVMKLSPEGELLLTLGETGRRGGTGTRPGDRGCSGSRSWSPSGRTATSISPRGIATRAPTTPRT